MEQEELEALVEGVRNGSIDPDQAVGRLQRLPYADLGFARVDHHRSIRQGLPETIYGPGKTPEQCAHIVAELLGGGDGPVVLTRTDDAQREAVAAVPGATVTGTTVVWRHAAQLEHNVLLATAGTADLPVADECAAVLEAYGVKPDRVADIGVAGIHRLLTEVDRIAEADLVIVVAGMEGALASVVGGLTAAPVIAVPTSVGYGASLEGVTALLGMLASCAAGITVVGIDNGYGAAVAAARMLRTR